MYRRRRKRIVRMTAHDLYVAEFYLDGYTLSDELSEIRIRNVEIAAYVEAIGLAPDIVWAKISPERNGLRARIYLKGTISKECEGEHYVFDS